MQRFLYTMVLGIFGAIGLAIVIYLSTIKLNETDDKLSCSNCRSSENNDAEAFEEKTPREVFSRTVPAVEATYDPALASQVEKLEHAVTRAEQAARDHRQLWHDTARLLVNSAAVKTQQDQEREPRTSDEMAELPSPVEFPEPDESSYSRIARSQDNEFDKVNADHEDVELRTAVNEQGEQLYDIEVVNADLHTVLEGLCKKSGLNLVTSKSVQGDVSATLIGVTFDEALSAILRSTGLNAGREGNLVYVGTQVEFQTQAHTLDKVVTKIYRPNYVTPAELQALIAPMLSPEIGSISMSSPAEVGLVSSESGNQFAGSDVVLVRDYEAVLTQIDQVFDEIDRRPLQVMIEAMILSVKLDDRLNLGVDFNAILNRTNGLDIPTTELVSGVPLQSLDALNGGGGGLKFGFLNSNLSVFIDALETVGDTNVIASPHLMCLNKQVAEILIGSQLGYVSTTVTESASTQTVEFLEVGTQLQIRPYISNDGMIRMEVRPELSTGNVRVEEGFTLPDKEVTQVTTNIMCRDGATIILGGLIREDLATNANQVPVFGSLPLLGALFRQKTETIDRRELIVLITPRIINDQTVDAESDAKADAYMHRQDFYADKMSPVGKRFYGRRYYRLAKQAWMSGDGSSALRFINMSVQFDPLDLDALELRKEIVASGYSGQTTNSHWGVGRMSWKQPIGKKGISAWIIDQLGSPSEDQAVGGNQPFDSALERNSSHETVERPLSGHDSDHSSIGELHGESILPGSAFEG